MKRFSGLFLSVLFLIGMMVSVPLSWSAQTSNSQKDDPWNTEDLDKMGNDLRGLFEEFLNKEASELRRTTGKSFYNLSGPAVDIRSTPEELIVECDVPGWDKKDISVELLSNVLVIRGKKPQAPAGDYYLQERWHDQFERKVTLPVNVTGEKVKAEQLNGVLTVRFPLKTTDAKSVKVKIA